MNADLPQPPPSHYEITIDASRIKAEAIGMMSRCDGWCSDQKGAFLVDLILKSKPEKIVEIGVFGGKSLIPMARALKANQCGVAYGIDPWDPIESTKETMEEVNRNYWLSVDHQRIKRRLIENICNFGLEQQIVLIQSTSEEARPIREIGLLHVDGNHSEKTSFFDVTKWTPLVKQGGYIVLDDMTWCEKGHFTTAKAAQWLDEHCEKVAEFTDDCKWGVWVKR
jgi:predicted O-methyltransferase YrrM